MFSKQSFASWLKTPYNALNHHYYQAPRPGAAAGTTGHTYLTSALGALWL